MSKILLALLVSLFAQAWADEYCTYYPNWPSSHTAFYEWCGWGCCYTYSSYPCCDIPIYVGTPFIVGISCGGVALVVGIIILVCVRRRRIITTVRYGTPGQQQVFSTTNTTTVGGGYSNPGFAGYSNSTNYSNQMQQY